MTVKITVSAQFTDNNGTPATGLTLTEVDITLISIRKSDGAETTVWAALDATREVTGLGLYQKDYVSADLETYWYFAMAQYVGATVLDSDFVFGEVGVEGLDVDGRVDVGDWLGQPVTLSAGNLPDVNVGEVSDDAAAADNLELQFDTTGLTGDTFPATQAQLGNIANVGAAINVSPESYVLTTGVQSSGTFADTAALDAVYHQHTDTGGVMELYYQFDVGGDGVPTSVTITGRINGNNDDLDGIYAWDWGSSSWQRVGDFEGQATATDVVRSYDLFTSHVGTGVNLGKVRIRFFAASGLTTATLSVDQIFTSYAVVARSVGYADGAIWFDSNALNTNTEPFVDGVADNPVSTWAAVLALSSQLNITRFHIVNGSAVLLSANSDNYTLIGDAWALALGGQSIDSAHFRGAMVTGTGTAAAANQPEFHDCFFGAVTLPASILDNCGIGVASGQFTAGSLGEFVFSQCFSMVPGLGNPALVFTGLGPSTGINNRAWKGGVTYTLDSNCTLSHEVLAGGGTTITTGGADVELRGICRAVTLVLSAAETAQFVGVTGPIILSGTTTAIVNLYGVSASLADSTSAATVTDKTVNQANINTEMDSALSDYDGPTNTEMIARTLVAASYGTVANQTNIEADTQNIQGRLPAAVVDGRMDSDIRAINANTDSATKLALSADTMEVGTAIAGTLSTTEMTTDLTEVTDDHYVGRVLIWTSGNLLRQVASIVGYDGGLKKLTFTAVTEAPVATDAWIMV